jgi:hypothetical protein
LEDPQFIDASAHGEGFEVLKNYMLQKTPPGIDAGIDIENANRHDLIGNRWREKRILEFMNFRSGKE